MSIHIDTLYPKNIYNCNNDSVFSKEQQENCHKYLNDACAYWIELCLTKPEQIKQIVYLADDIIEIAKKIPSYLDKNLFVDMRIWFCDVMHSIANKASKLQSGLTVNIDNEIKAIQLKFG